MQKIGKKHNKLIMFSCSFLLIALFSIVVQIPAESGHPFRFIPATDSGAIRPPIPVHSGQFFPDSGIDIK